MSRWQKAQTVKEPTTDRNIGRSALNGSKIKSKTKKNRIYKADNVRDLYGQLQDRFVWEHYQLKIEA
ncbi:MAG: hypothetical protein IPN82_16120 [Chitinophagaceae bacterium]|nr:hypothetical protein [Chitinophagaceae bacterium]